MHWHGNFAQNNECDAQIELFCVTSATTKWRANAPPKICSKQDIFECLLWSFSLFMTSHFAVKKWNASRKNSCHAYQVIYFWLNVFLRCYHVVRLYQLISFSSTFSVLFCACLASENRCCLGKRLVLSQNQRKSVGRSARIILRVVQYLNVQEQKGQHKCSNFRCLGQVLPRVCQKVFCGAMHFFCLWFCHFSRVTLPCLGHRCGCGVDRTSQLWSWQCGLDADTRPCSLYYHHCKYSHCTLHNL